jgi:hypothetical protein
VLRNSRRSEIKRAVAFDRPCSRVVSTQAHQERISDLMEVRLKSTGLLCIAKLGAKNRQEDF